MIDLCWEKVFVAYFLFRAVSQGKGIGQDR